jgi:hypothetical protein
MRPLTTASTSVAAARPQNRRRVLRLPWITRLPEGLHEITARACSGVGSISSVEYSIDGGEWRQAEMRGPNIARARVRFEWEALPHQLYELTTPEGPLLCHAGQGAGGRVGAGLAIACSCPAHGTVCRYMASRKPVGNKGFS